MKLILSRKGFDSAAGGCPSPIMPDARLISLPIPSGRGPARFADVMRDDEPVGQLVSELMGRPHGARLPCHLDPDLDPGALPRDPEWRAAFGQVGAAQTHLARQGVGIGDIFLFFGWFREVERGGGTWRFRPAAPHLHVLFGWLQIGEILAVGEDPSAHLRTLPWLRQHPHLANSYGISNTVYVAASELRLGDRPLSAPGAGLFRHFRPALQLTVPGQTRSIWTLPSWFSGEPGRRLSYHGNPVLWGNHGAHCHLKTVGRGQEFVLDVADRPYALDWIAQLIDGGDRT